MRERTKIDVDVRRITVSRLPWLSLNYCFGIGEGISAGKSGTSAFTDTVPTTATPRPRARGSHCMVCAAALTTVAMRRRILLWIESPVLLWLGQHVLGSGRLKRRSRYLMAQALVRYVGPRGSTIRGTGHAWPVQPNVATLVNPSAP
jgi:hypothetical protein